MSGCRRIAPLLEPFMDGELAADKTIELEQHLAGCPRCTSLCDSLRATLQMCQTAGASRPVPAAVRSSVQQAVRNFIERHDAGSSAE